MPAAPFDRKLYNILLDKLAELQAGRCGICGSDDEGLVVDHEHSSGMVRGLLCGECNRAEGRHGDDCPIWRWCPTCMWRVIPAVVQVGWTTQYRPSIHAFELYNPLHPFEPTGEAAARSEATERAAVARLDAALAPVPEDAR